MSLSLPKWRGEGDLLVCDSRFTIIMESSIMHDLVFELEVTTP